MINRKTTTPRKPTPYRAVYTLVTIPSTRTTTSAVKDKQNDSTRNSNHNTPSQPSPPTIPHPPRSSCCLNLLFSPTVLLLRRPDCQLDGCHQTVSMQHSGNSKLRLKRITISPKPSEALPCSLMYACYFSQASVFLPCEGPHRPRVVHHGHALPSALFPMGFGA